MLDARGKWVARIAAHALDVGVAQVEACLVEASHIVNSFFGADGQRHTKLVFTRVPAPADGRPASVALVTDERPALTGRAVYFARLDPEKPVTSIAIEVELTFGTITEGLAIDGLQQVLDTVVVPSLRADAYGWSKRVPAPASADFFAALGKCSSSFAAAIGGLRGGMELAKPGDALRALGAGGTADLSRAAEDSAVVHECEEVMEDWCAQTTRLLNDTDERHAEPEDTGPSTELTYWRTRMTRLNSITEQLKLPACRAVVSVLGLAKSRVLKRWKALDNQVTDATNEAKDNVKYLSTLEKYIEPLYSGTPASICDSLPALLTNVRMMQAVARHYNTEERMTALLRKITNQMIHNCRDFVTRDAGCWEQPPEQLVGRLEACLRLHEAYRAQYDSTRAVAWRASIELTNGHAAGARVHADARGAAGARPSPFDFNEQAIFGRLELFSRRVEKLIDMFRTIHQFSELSNHKIEGLDAVLSNLFSVVDELRRKPYDVLNFTNNQFDRDYLEFNANIHELESSLQGFINHSFETTPTTDHALSLLRQFQAIMQRESLKDDLDSKLALIFSNFNADLEAVQRVYERQKSNPAAVRNAPPVAGNIAWARQLLRRIEAPMRNFQANSTLMATREAKKITKVYNKVARTIIEFETLWHLAWTKSIESSKIGLNATLLVLHPADRRIYVNFDPEILQLLRETKSLLRMGAEVPESAQAVLLIEPKLKAYRSKLSHALGEYEATVARISPVLVSIFRPHLEQMEAAIAPGLTLLTWSSMNIDMYLASVHASLFKLNELVSKADDIALNRIGRNLHIVRTMQLVHLPDEGSGAGSTSPAHFVEMQRRRLADASIVLLAKNDEVIEAVGDLVAMIAGASVLHVPSKPVQLAEQAANAAAGGAAQPAVQIDPVELERIRAHFADQIYEAMLAATYRSLETLKDRIGTRASGGVLSVERPLFDVNVNLAVPEIILSPGLDEIQEAVNKASRLVLDVSKQLARWGSAGAPVHERIARDKEIVKVVLLLTSSLEGAKRGVLDFLVTFAKYEWLWKEEMGVAYAHFLESHPQLDDFEAELKKYVAIEAEIAQIPPLHNIGAISLDTKPLKAAFQAEAGAWKAQYAKNLHSQAHAQLSRLTQWMHDMARNLRREVTDLDDVRFAVDNLQLVRSKEAALDSEFAPVEEMYAMLQRYNVHIPKEEVDVVTDLRYSWKKLKKIADELQEHLGRMQAPFKKNLVRNVKLFVVDVFQFRNDFEATGPGVPGVAPQEAEERLRRYQRLFEERERKWDAYEAGERLFGLPVTEYPELVKTKQELQLLEKLYNLYGAVISTVGDYNEMLWADVPANLSAMVAKISDFQLAVRRMPKALREWDAFVELKRTIDTFLESLPLVQMLTHPGMRLRHWESLCKVANVDLAVGSESFTLQALLDADLLEYREDVEEIANAAVKELQIEEKLAGVSTDWSDRTLSFSQFKARGPIILSGGATAELMELLEEAQMVLGSMMASRYVAPFKEDVQEWITKLSTVSEIVESWVQVQSMWMYLEAVFTSGDIAKQLPGESKRFQGIDKNWMKIMQKANEQPIVVQYCYGNDVLQQLLPHLLEQLEMCQKALSGYLDQKRAAFPRFYFVSDPNLLEILSQGSNPEAIQPHLQSVFDSIESVTFARADRSRIEVISSNDGQSVTLLKGCKAEGNIEDWLNALLREMRDTIKAIVRAAADDCEVLTTTDLTNKYAAQVSLIAIQFKWTADCEDALFRAKAEKGIMGQTNKKNQARLNELVAMNLQPDEALRKFGKWTRRKIETMITVDVHQRDVWEEIVKRKVRDTEDFEWQKQARFYWRYDLDYAMISVADVDFKYCNEYLGVKERLVITPLTDRCYITLAQALGMFLGGAPAGPAGTGKTETTKDMGCTLGKYVVVTNCSDQMDYRIMGNILKGLAQSGCWGCFDEFNRIDLEVLSVVAQQVMSVLVAIREDRKTFQFTDGQVIALDKEVGFFITMNPGYAGRQELPENLKSLFRGVTMMVPDREIIMKVKLIACGYRDATLLAKKFNVLYKLCEEQLSKQAHYDFGLRNILAVLRTAGASKREQQDKPELELLMRSLRDMNLSKFVAEDVPLFMSTIEDLFPGMHADKKKHPEVEEAIGAVVRSSGLQAHGAWLLKIVQVYEMALVRHSVMSVGPSGVGKTRLTETLHRALSSCAPSLDLPPMVGQPHRESRMNPKAITSPQMFGALDVIANEWTEGIFAQLWRKANKDKKNFTWIVLDGPVDAIWIENLNTVMDDNRILTLANNDRIPMLRPNVTLNFEVEDLRNASPATVSRAGIIYISENDLGWAPYVASWCRNTEVASFGQALRPLFEQYVDPLLDFIRKECSQKMACAPIALLQSMCTLLDGLVPLLPNVETLSKQHVVRVFTYALIWTVGAILENADRARVDSFLREHALDLPPPGDVGGHDDTVYDYFVDEKTCEWAHWERRVPEWSYAGTDLASDFPTITIPTVDSVRTIFTLETSIRRGRAVLLIGGPGTAKTTSILQVLAKQDQAKTLAKKVSFSAATTPLIFQKTIEGSVEKRQGKTFGPPGGKNMLVFVDDISMPQINSWGDQPTLEIVRQLVEQGGLYNLQKPGEIMQIVDLLVLGCMLQPGGGKQDIPNRAKRHFHLMNVPLPGPASIAQIFGSLVRIHFPDAPVGDGARPIGDDVLALSRRLVELTVAVWDAVKAKMLPTPSKFHYIFNLRDLSRVFQGIFSCPVGEVLGSEAVLLQLWRHEATRVFQDRLIDAADKAWFDASVSRLIEERLGAARGLHKTPVAFFVDFLRPAPEDAETGEALPPPKVYEPVPNGNFDVLREVIGGYMARFRESNKLQGVSLVLFDDALHHFMRISRIIRTARGSALLVGVGGSGKQSLSRLASYMAEATIAQITLTKQYNANNLLEDFKPLYRTAGVLNRSCSFIFTDKEIKEEDFLEYLNIFLNTGELPNLFARDEVDGILGEVARPYGDLHRGHEPTQDDLWAFFLKRVRANLHLVLCFSPVGAKFRERAQKFPGLINNCTIDWFLPWPQQALIDVAASGFEGFTELQAVGEVRSALIGHMAHIHNAVRDSTTEYFERYRRYAYVTPKSFLSFVGAYQDVYRKKVAHVEMLASNINTGLTKLVEAGEDVAKMKIELKEKEKGLVVAQEKSAVLLQEITTNTAKAEKKKAEVQGVKDVLAAEADVIAGQKADVERDLAAAQPALDEAENALKAINAKDIQLLKQLKSPPEIIRRIFDCVLILLGGDIVPCALVKPKERFTLEASWSLALPMMGKSTFLEDIMHFDRDAINDETVELLHPYISAEDFTYDDAKKASGNVAGLCTWVRAMDMYTTIAKVVKPKMEQLRVAENKLKVANAKLAKAQGELDGVQTELHSMQIQFDDAMATKQRIQDDADATQKRMDSANKLINGLAGERDRWTNLSEYFADEIRRLTGDVALSCAFIEYVGPFNADFRETLLARFYTDCQQRHIPVTDALSVTKFMADESTIGDWALEGLPSDELSVQNGIMVTRSSKWPLLIDPQGQGLQWLKNREHVNGLKVTQLIEKKFRNHLEDAMSFGTPLVIENVEEELDPIIDPVLDRQVQRKGRALVIVLADKECEYSEAFKLFLTSKIANPHFSPELCAQLTVINFTVTMGGLEQQLLARTLQHERAELEEQRQKLVEDVNSNQKILKQLEDDLLFRLANSTGNLLDDTELMEVLNNTKTTSAEVKEKLANAADTDKRINVAREEYRPVATRGSLLYFLITDMANINPMYQTSLTQFLGLFDASIVSSEKTANMLASKRTGAIIEYMTFYVTCYVQRGLFEAHRLVWVLMLTMRIEGAAEQLAPSYVQCLLKAGGALDIKSERPKPCSWLPDASWLNLIQLGATVSALRDVCDSFVRNDGLWKAWYDEDAPETAKVPEYEERLSAFEKLLVVRCVREDRTLLSVSAYITESLGQRYMDSRPLDLRATEEEASHKTPLIALLSQGADPTGVIMELAKKKKKQVQSISMGQGQEPAARKLIQIGTSVGSWVMLQNCHLGLKFMVEIEQTILKMDEQVNAAFRLWVTCEPHPKFPIGLLQLSIKITNEAPAGIRAGLKGSYAWLNQDVLDAVSQPQWKTMLFALCFMHTVVQERRKFGPLGFNVPYEFNQSDLSASVQFMQNHLNDVETKKRPVDWTVVNYMVCEVQYGGRITDDWDRRLFNTYGIAWLTSRILQPTFSFYELGSLRYAIPTGNMGDIDTFRRYIEAMPLIDNPEVFGLHTNADLAYRTMQTNVVLETILDVQPKESGGGGGLTREEIVLRQAEDLQVKLPADFKRDVVNAQIKAIGGMSRPLNICLSQEVDRLQRVIGIVRRMIINLKLAIAGTIVMSAELSQMLDALFMARVPAFWQNVSQLIMPNIGLWWVNILSRNEQLVHWLQSNRPHAFWLTGFFNPQGFLTANRQEVCRRHAKENWALDDMVDASEVLKSEKDDLRRGPEEGVYIYGLFLDGCKWDKGKDRLVDSDPKVLYAQLPVIHIGAVLGVNKRFSPNEVYSCPLYKTPKRTGLNFVTAIELRTDEPPFKWVLRGVCLLCSKD
ncbi:hypothetical protein KFE25_008869 [Diacronema lutheri]|uniref:AAA+ ATPase domain-containing protein n=1 Tax=Diacronema lutheri TaxID=2081491 RepID=A0A8J5XLV2_DIALT|nr:hypothetical protein KFE25_008869 [Diacronema lutheri]